MYKIPLVFLVSLILQISGSFAQQADKLEAPTVIVHDYYISIAGVNSRADVEQLESLVQRKDGVSYFLARRYPPRYFRLQSTKSLTGKDFSSWLDSRFTVRYFGEGSEGKERAIMAGKKSKSIQ